MPLPADLPSWVYGYAVLFGLVHVVLLYYLYRTTGTTAETAGARAAAPEESEDVEVDGTVQCANCGAENERGFRYCRNCVEELPGAVDRTSASAGPAGRGIL